MEVKINDEEGLDMPRVLAALAEKEREALEVIKADLCHWLARPDVLQLDIAPACFLDTLDSGVEVCRLASLVQQAAVGAKEKGIALGFTVPMEALNCNTKASGVASSFYARNNASNFISWCRGLGVQEAVVFESEGLVLHKDEKSVILCLLDVARFAERVGIPPPQLVRMEREIEALESHSNSSSGKEVSLEVKTDVDRPTDPPETSVHSPNARSQHHTKQKPHLTPPKPGSHLSSDSKKGHISMIPVRRSRRRVGRTSKSLPVRNEARKSQKRGRSSDEEEPHEPSTKRTKLDGGRRVTGGEGGRVMVGGEEKQTKESLDESVMRKMAECTCQNKIEVTNCGNGKFIVKGASGRTMTTYARLLSDRLMVRVGGGWDTLDHFFLKHDPCRVHALSSNR